MCCDTNRVCLFDARVVDQDIALYCQVTHTLNAKLPTSQYNIWTRTSGIEPGSLNMQCQNESLRSLITRRPPHKEKWSYTLQHHNHTNTTTTKII